MLVPVLEALEDHIRNLKCGSIATLCGRLHAMDRDTRWDRVEQAYRLYTEGRGIYEKDPVAAVEHAYARKETDEFVKPIVITDDNQSPVALIKDNDGLIFFNFRSDRAREITRAFTDDKFEGFRRKNYPRLSDFVCMTRYDETFSLPVAFGPVHLDNILGEVLSRAGLHQLRIAETEKYAHVTYFFNGGEEHSFPNEDRCLIPSPPRIKRTLFNYKVIPYGYKKHKIENLALDDTDLIRLHQRFARHLDRLVQTHNSQDSGGHITQTSRLQPGGFA